MINSVWPLFTRMILSNQRYHKALVLVNSKIKNKLQAIEASSKYRPKTNTENRFIAEELSTSYLIIWCGIVTEFVCKRVLIVIWLFAEVYCHHLSLLFVLGRLKARIYLKQDMKMEEFDIILTCPRFSVFVPNLNKRSETGSNKCTLELRRHLVTDTKFRRLVRRLRNLRASNGLSDQSVLRFFVFRCPKKQKLDWSIVLSDNDCTNSLRETIGEPD